MRYIFTRLFWFDVGRRLNFFWTSLTRNSDKFKRPISKMRVICMNAKHMFKRWALEKPIVDSFLSLRAYLRLHKAGFRITNSKSQDGRSEINRFWWKTEIIKDMADIDRVDDHYITMFNDRSERLGPKPKLQSRNRLYEEKDIRAGGW